MKALTYRIRLGVAGGGSQRRGGDKGRQDSSETTHR
jgi:hypothetical protein